VLLAAPAAPFNVFGVSPAPLMIVLGIALGTAFFVWTQRRAAARQTPLLALEVIASPREWAAVIALFMIVGMEAAINFAVPLYIQIIQGRSSMATSIAMMPFMLTVFFTAILVVRLYDRFTPRQIATYAFLLVIAGTLWLAFVASNDWSVFPVILGLITVGIGQGALVTLLFNVLVTAAPKEQAGDVGSLRGVTQNLAAAVGTAVMGALLVGLLSSMIMSNLVDNPVIPAEFKRTEVAERFDLDNINFIRNEQLKERLQETSATPEQVDEAVRINTESRLRALKIGFLFLSSLALLALFPCQWLPGYRPGDIPT
jgi:MFS family permease